MRNVTKQEIHFQNEHQEKLNKNLHCFKLLNEKTPNENAQHKLTISYLVCFVQSVLPGSLPVWAEPLWSTAGWELRKCPVLGEQESPLAIGCRGSGSHWSERTTPLSDWEMLVRS